MRERKPIEEIIYSIVEMILTVVMLIIFLFILLTHGEETALIDLMFVFGILLNVLVAAYFHYKTQKRAAAVHFIYAAICLILIFL